MITPVFATSRSRLIATFWGVLRPHLRRVFREPKAPTGRFCLNRTFFPRAFDFKSRKQFSNRNTNVGSGFRDISRAFETAPIKATTITAEASRMAAERKKRAATATAVEATKRRERLAASIRVARLAIEIVAPAESTAAARLDATARWKAAQVQRERRRRQRPSPSRVSAGSRRRACLSRQGPARTGIFRAPRLCSRPISRSDCLDSSRRERARIGFRRCGRASAPFVKAGAMNDGAWISFSRRA